MEKQGKQLFQSLVFTVNNLRKPDALSDALRAWALDTFSTVYCRNTIQW